MLQINIKKIKLSICGLIGVLALSLVNLPAVHAADNCLVTAPYQENIWSDPRHSGVFYVGVASVCEMKLYDIDVSFTDIDTVEGLTRYYTNSHEDFSNVESLDDGLRMRWSGKEDEQEGVDYIELNSSNESWDYLFGQWYDIPISSLNPPATFKRNLPAVVNSAHYEVNGEMREVKNLVLNSVLVKAPDYDKDVLMISGVEKQAVTYTDHPVVLEGELTVEENDDNITAEDLIPHYYVYDEHELSFTPIERPTDPGEFYLVDYTFENDHYRASLRVPFMIKDYITVDTNIWEGHGEVSAPRYVDVGGTLHVDITPAEDYEIVWVEHNGDDVTDLLNEDNSLDIENVNENAEIIVAFRAVYQVTNGNGSEYTKGSDSDLAFVVDKNPASYTDGEVLVVVDGSPVDLDNDVVVRSEAQTITLLSKYLNTLAVGNHNVEIYFFDTSFAGIARSSFAVVEAATDDSDKTADADDGESTTVPDTGAFTASTNGVNPTNLAAIISGTVIAATVLFLAKRFFKK